MGFKEWRQRQLDRADAMTAWADRTEAEAKARQAELKAEQAESREQRAAVSLEEWMQRRAQQLGEDHDDLASRAAAVGMGGPVPERRRGPGVLGALGELVVMDGSGVGGHHVDAYEGWRDRIVVEEAMAAKVARGESLNKRDRWVLKIARQSSK